MLSRNNHYLSQMYLNAWSNNKTVQVYETLVPDKNVPWFQEKNIRRVASYDSMYVRVDKNEEIDDIEKMFSKEYESPAKVALDKAIQGLDLTEEELNKLIELMTSIMVRTPSHIMKSLSIMKESSKEELKEIPLITKNEVLKEEINNPGIFPGVIKKIIPYDNDTSIVYFETMIGKQAYLSNMLMNIKKYSEELKKKSWTIATVDNSITLPTSDNPIIRMKYIDKDHYKLDIPINEEYGTIIFPISPKKVLMAQNGLSQEKKTKLNKKGSNFIKKLILENSYRMVLSKDKDQEIPSLLPRTVNLEQYLEEKETWSNFQKTYLEEEKKYIR